MDVCKLILTEVENKNPAATGPLPGWTPLHLAAREGFLDVFRLLIEYVDIKDPVSDAGQTPKSLAQEYNHEDIVKIFETALETIIQRGKTNLVDKTIADSLNLIIKKLKDEQNYLITFKNATKEALANFKGKKIKIGRARMFEDKTKDLDDPGMYALYLLCSKL